jgi:hypothetical protein
LQSKLTLACENNEDTGFLHSYEKQKLINDPVGTGYSLLPIRGNDAETAIKQMQKDVRNGRYIRFITRALEIWNQQIMITIGD